MSEQPQSEPQDNISQSPNLDRDLFVVGIGASAGGLSALEELFSNLSTASGAAFVVIQHLSPDFKSLMKELLERRTTMSVYRVTDGMELEPNSVYLIPPGQNLALEENILRLEDRKKNKNHKHELNFPIDLFFCSLAENYGEQSIGVILSGTGSDGTRGLKAINEAGGVALVQDPETAEFDGMPVSAIATGLVNQILPPRELSHLIYQCVVAPVNSRETEIDQNNLLNSVHLAQIAKLLLEEEALDFSQYKSTTISRRIHRRCLIHSSKSVDDYINLLERSTVERQILCSDLLINVTHFFRDYPAWQNLENNILPLLIEQSQNEGELRFWITACSTGEEAYSLAILVYEALQDTDKNIRVKIFATDIDKVALDKASQGIYPSSIARDIGTERLQRYFVARDGSYQIMRKIREMLIFSPHDLTKDAGFTRINLVTCRNVLIYMKSDLQYQVLRNLHFSLVSKGVLFLGVAETLGEFESEFEPLNKKWKFFQKQRDIRLSLPLKSTPKIGKSPLLRYNQAQSKVQFEPILEQCLNRLSNESDSIILLINKENNLLHVSGDSSKIFKAPDGKITTEVIKMIALPLQLPLNTALHRAKQKRKSVLYHGIKIEYQGKVLAVNLEVIPPQTNHKHGDFFMVKIQEEKAIIPTEIPQAENFELDTEASRRIIELENELQQTRENLQALVEELETTNEEQQASNEELTASNEELQSTNEELHSVNEELHTVNIEYQSKIQELIQLNNDIDNLLKSTDIGVVFLDRELRIRKFTPAATMAIALRNADLERPLEDLSYKIECPNLLELLQDVLVIKQPIEQEVKLKHDESYLLMRINLYHTEDNQTDGIVISFVRIDEIKKVQQELENTMLELKAREQDYKRQLAAVENAADGIAILNDDKFIFINQAHAEIFGYTNPQELIGQAWHILYEPEETERFKQEILPVLQTTGQWQGIVTARHRDGHTFAEELTFTFTDTGDLICICRDITQRLAAEAELRSQKAELSQLNHQLEKRVAQRTEALANFTDHLKQLHRLAIGEYETSEDLFADYIQAGCEIFDLSTGIVSQVTDCTYKILAVQSPLDMAVGLELDCKNTYCKEVVEKRTNVAYFDVGQVDEMQNHPVYLQFDLKSFIGTPIFVNGNLYGTLNFSSVPPRSSDFTSSEREIIEFMARDIGQAISSFQAAKALKKSESQFRQTFEQATVGITHVSLEGRFLEVNSKLCQILGYSRPELIKLTFQEITYPEDLVLDEQHVGQIMAGEVESCIYEKRYVRANGSIIWAEITFCLAKLEGSEPPYFIAVIEDISDRKQGEIALQQASKAKDSFIAHMSHELRTPLNSVIGFSHILKNDSELTAKQLKSVEIINQSGQHLLTLINDVLNLSKLNANKLELLYSDLYLVHFIHDIAAIFQLRAQEKGLDFVVEISPDLPAVVNADETRLRQILLNLLSNAIKFTDSGSVRLSVSYSKITAASDIKKIRFLVEDTGRGIPQNKYTTVFSAFGQVEQSSSDSDGTGLGLPICQSILNLMNSELHLESKVGQGSKFWFELDLEEVYPQSCLLEIQSNAQPLPTLSTSCKVLVVDDNKDNRILLVHHLQPLGFIIAEADNGQTGLAIAEEFRPDVILVDLLMPVMDGKEMIQRIRRHHLLRETVVLMISANIQLILDPSDINYDGFIAKPIDLEQLLASLTEHLQIEWQIPTPELESTAALIFPPEAELRNLLELVNFGDMEALLEEIDLLEIRDSQYISLTKKMRQLAENCQQDRLERLLKTSSKP